MLDNDLVDFEYDFPNKLIDEESKSVNENKLTEKKTSKEKQIIQANTRKIFG